MTDFEYTLDSLIETFGKHSKVFQQGSKERMENVADAHEYFFDLPKFLMVLAMEIKSLKDSK